ncbi:MAG: ABC transporter substrate-binding protein [Thermodesulfobacteriota bacterium]
MDRERLKKLPSPGDRATLPSVARNDRAGITTQSLRGRGLRERGGKWIPFLVLFFLNLSWTSVSFPGTHKFIDEVGREVVFPYPPKRIVSLAPNITEILFSLGLDQEIVGVSTHCNYPEKAKSKARVGSYISLDFEKVTLLKPDLVIATGSGNTREMVDRLEKLGFPTYVIFPKNFTDILESTDHLGKVVGREKEAAEIIRGMKERSQRVARLTQGLSRPRVFLQIGEAPLVTVGKGSFGNDLIHLAGGENIAEMEKEMYPRIGMEEILRRSPEVILVSSMNPKGDYQRVLQEWFRWKAIPAVKSGRVYLIDSDLIDRPSPRIVDGLEEIARILHPEKFKKSMQN